MNNKKPLISRWYFKLTLTILVLVVAYLIGKSFIEGYKEGRQMKAIQSQNK